MKLPHYKAENQTLNVLVVVCAAIAISLMALGYLRAAQAEEQERVNQVVQESAIQSVALIREHLFNDVAHIEQIGRSLGQRELPINDKKVLSRLAEDESIGKTFKSITTAAMDGTLYAEDGRELGNISDHPHFQAAIEGKTSISDMEKSVVDHRDVICVTAPILRDGEVVGIVNGRFLMSSLTKFLSAESFGGRGYSYMVNTQGEIFARSDNPNANHDLGFTNIFASFEQNKSISAEMLVEMRQSMENGGSGWTSYQWGGDARTMNYMPVGINDWYFLSVLPNEIVSSRAMVVTKQAFALTGALMVVVVLLIFYIDGARRKDQNALAAVHKELLTIYNTIPGGVFKCRIDERFTLIEANDGFYRFIGYTKEALREQFSNELARLLLPEDVVRIKMTLAQQLKAGGTASDEVRLIGEDGSSKWLLICGDVLWSPTGETLVYCCFTDISELKRTQQELQEAKQRYDLILEEMQEIIFEWDPVKRTVHHSRIFEEKFGYPCALENFPESILDCHLVPPEDAERCMAVYRRIEEGNRFSSGEFRIRKRGGSFLWCSVSITAVLDDQGRFCRGVGVIADIDHVKQELMAVTERAQRDAMTGLYNKATTEQLMAQRLKTPIGRGTLFAVDIDNFKAVNDTLGHASGDLALTEVARQLRNLFDERDIVGRVGGDEFLVFVTGQNRREDLEQKLAEISAVFNWSFCKNDLRYSISCSIGVAQFPGDGNSYGELFKKADAALYFAKQNGKNQFAIYREGMQKSIHGVEDAESVQAEGVTPQA